MVLPKTADERRELLQEIRRAAGRRPQLHSVDQGSEAGANKTSPTRMRLACVRAPKPLLLCAAEPPLFVPN